MRMIPHRHTATSQENSYYHRIYRLLILVGEYSNKRENDVSLLIENQRYRSAVNRIYYGMFYSLLALGIAVNFSTLKHSQLLGWFNKSFIRDGIIEMKYGKMIKNAFNSRSRGDYHTFVIFDEATVISLFEDMKDFISRIKQYIESKE